VSLGRRLQELERAHDHGPTLILMSWDIPEHKRIGSAKVHGENVSRSPDESDEAFHARVKAKALRGYSGRPVVIFLTEEDERL
jgi:hypothetical protein